MEPISKTAQQLIRGWSAHRQDKGAVTIKNNLRQLLTRQERKHITTCVLKNTQLLLKVDSSAWLYQLNLKKEQLFRCLNQSLGPTQKIEEILLRLDRDEKKD
jgi:predicted nucleic acid-binding Zn ribbon protein